MAKTLKLQILETIADHPGIGQFDIHQTIPTTTKKSISSYMASLKREKYVHTIGHNKHYLLPKGIQEMKESKATEMSAPRLLVEPSPSNLSDAIMAQDPLKKKARVTLNFSGIDLSFDTVRDPARVVEELVELKKKLES